MTPEATDSPHPLSGFIGALVRQVHRFACLAGERSDQAQFNRIMLARFKLLKLLLALPSTARLVSSACAGEPFIYNTATWPADGPPAGYFQSDGPISPQAHLDSRVMMWTLQYQSTSIMAAGRRMLRAALWMLDAKGMGAAIRYLLDLQTWGFVFDSGSTIWALSVLLTVRRRVPSDDDIVAAFLDSRQVAREGWIGADLSDPDVLDRPVVRSPHDDLDLIVQWAETEIDAVLDARSYDDWVVGQLRLRESMNLARAGLETQGHWEDLGYAASTSRIEVVRADAFAVRQTGRYAVLEGRFAYGADFTVAEAPALALVLTAADWRHQLSEQRALLPAELEPLLMHEHGLVTLPADQLPMAWRGISVELAALYASCVNEDEHLAWARREPIAFDKVQSLGLGSEWLDANSKGSAAARAAWLELACIRGESGARDDQQTQHLRELMAQMGIDQDTQDQRVRQLRQRIAADELHGYIETFTETDLAPQEALALWERVVALYPYFDPALQEQAIALDQLGRTREALTVLLDAVLLRPDEPLCWESLSEVLRRLGWAEESHLCLYLAEQLQSEEPGALQ